MSKITDFYLDDGTTVEGLTWEDIMNFEKDDLEECHVHIQWLFPLKEASSMQPTAPILTDEDIDTLKDNPVFIGKYKKGLIKMMDFYGFQPVIADEFFINQFYDWDDRDDENKQWITPNNHNFLRITRIINSLRLFKQYKLCYEVFRCFSNLYWDYPEYKEIIGEISYQFWKEASDYEKDFTLLDKFYDRKKVELTNTEEIVFDILADVTDRRGWRQEWDGFDIEIKEEIIKTWINLINSKYNNLLNES